VVCDGRVNDAPIQKNRRPEGFCGKGGLASLFVGHRPLRVCSGLTPRQPALSTKTVPFLFCGVEEWRGGD
jgi:hypothetical protein